MDKFAALRAYVMVVDERGFAAAARTLGQSRSAVNRMVIALEDRLGVQLLNRTTRQVAPTANGTLFHTRAKSILADLDAAERELGEVHQTVSGRLRINAPMTFGTMYLGSAVADFMALYPDLTLELHLNDRTVDIIEEGFDISIRIAEPREDTSLVDFRICEINRVICAAPTYLETHGRPEHPRELKEHACLHYGHLPSGNAWSLIGPKGAMSVQVRSVLCCNNGEVLRDAAVAGCGICLEPTFIVAEDLRSGRLVPILESFTSASLVLSAIYPPSRHLSAKIRLFTDFLLERFGKKRQWRSDSQLL